MPPRCASSSQRCALTAADQPVNKKAVTTAAPRPRSASYQDHSQLLDDVRSISAPLRLLQLVGVAVTAADLGRQLEHAHQIIRDERARRENAETELRTSSPTLRLRWLTGQDAILRERQQEGRGSAPVGPDREPERVPKPQPGGGEYWFVRASPTSEERIVATSSPSRANRTWADQVTALPVGLVADR